MASTAARRAAYGAWIMAVAGAAATALSAYNYLTRGTGIDHTLGALLVIISSALILLASLVIALAPGAPRWLRGVLIVLLLLGVLGTALAAYFLEAWALVGLMALALIGWLVQLGSGRGGARLEPVPARS
jgi:hypothetical protein